jgi:hypothetical protein
MLGAVSLQRVALVPILSLYRQIEAGLTTGRDGPPTARPVCYISLLLNTTLLALLIGNLGIFEAFQAVRTQTRLGNSRYVFDGHDKVRIIYATTQEVEWTLLGH